VGSNPAGRTTTLRIMGFQAMRTRLLSFTFCLTCLFWTIAAGAPHKAGAEEVSLSAGGLTLGGNLEIAPGKALKDGVVLMTHGTLAHNRMEIIATLQELLTARGISSLAITLSLGIDKRRGMYDCVQPHRHKHSDAPREIGQWIDWLKARGSGPIVLFGHSRGGNQTAWVMADHADDAVRGAVLLAPATWDKDKQDASYKKAYKKPLGPILAKTTRMNMAGQGDVLIEGIDFLYCPNATVSAATFHDYYAEDPFHDTPTALRRVKKKPVLVIAGSEDSVVDDLPEKIEGYNPKVVSFTVIEGADHFFRDLYAEDVADLIAAFVSEHL